MEREWTEDQKKVIESRGKNLLVSAAAGSGKTSVLTERIVSFLTDKDKPLDIDDILVVTFTRAAAQEMKDRISAAIDKKLDTDPHDYALIRQKSLLLSAQISTIDSFCGYVVKNYFQTIGLVPGFRTAEPNEMKLIEEEILTEVLDELYEENEEAFTELMNAFGKAKGDERVRSMINEIVGFAASYPDERGYIEGLHRYYECDSLDGCEWLKEYLANVHYSLEEAYQILEDAIIEANALGLNGADEFLSKEVEQLDKMLALKDYGSLRDALWNTSFDTYPQRIKKNYAGDPKDAERIKAARDDAKNIVTGYKKKLSATEKEELLLLHDTAANAAELSRIALKYYDRLTEEKKKRRIFGFSDIEHFALDILCDVKTGEPKAPAFDLAGRFKEIMTDEYQDTNYVQEMIFSSIVSASKGKTNLFMVGDVKQSIYGFRQARPDIFIDKAERFRQAGDDARDELMVMGKNFRSETNVIRDVNHIFSKLMHSDFGGIEYDASQRLYYSDPDTEDKYDDKNKTELLVALTNSDDEEDSPDAVRLEARLIAMRIKELLGQDYKCSDIAILAPSVKYISGELIDVLGEYGINMLLSKDEGYFDTVEIKVLVNFLMVLCNPKTDIELAGLMLSPLYSFTNEELARIRGANKSGKRRVYDDIKDYIHDNDDTLAGKLSEFLNEITSYRKRALELGIRGILEQVIRDKDYLYYVMMRPAGLRREANIRMLLSKAGEFEKNGARTIYEFVRYIEILKKYKLEGGQAEASENKEDAVHVMTIHKSKGLEFPVVILAGIHKRLLKQNDTAVVCDVDLGAAIPVVYKNRHIKRKNLLEKVITEKKRDAELAERCRLLYVALTRAKKKIIMTGVSTEKKLNKLADKGMDDDYPRFNTRKSAMYYLDLVYPIACCSENYTVKNITLGELDEFEKKLNIQRVDKTFDIFSYTASADGDMSKELAQRLAFKYPYEAETSLAAKVSVSELKHRAKDDEASYIYEKKSEPYIPAFVRKEEKVNRGAAVGTAIHRLMELLRFDGPGVEEQIEELIQKHQLTEEEGAAIRVNRINVFLSSGLGKRMKSAYERGELHRETPFTMRIKASDVFDEDSGDENIMVQGVIDAWFYEGNDIILLDYKSDFVDNSDELVKRYSGQLELYKKALGDAVGRNVKSAYIYSFCLGCEIEVGL